jgi:hypothetical protein
MWQNLFGQCLYATWHNLDGQCLNAKRQNMGGKCLNATWPSLGGQCLNVVTWHWTNQSRFDPNDHHTKPPIKPLIIHLLLRHLKKNH